MRYIKKGTDTYRIIDDQFDEKLFEQMITNDVFDKQSMIALINGSFNMVLRLEAPERDKATLESRQRVFDSEPEKIVSTFIREINQCLDLIDVDFINLFAEKKNWTF